MRATCRACTYGISSPLVSKNLLVGFFLVDARNYNIPIIAPGDELKARFRPAKTNQPNTGADRQAVFQNSAPLTSYSLGAKCIWRRMSDLDGLLLER
jgi:hypothetical protein